MHATTVALSVLLLLSLPISIASQPLGSVNAPSKPLTAMLGESFGVDLSFSNDGDQDGSLPFVDIAFPPSHVSFDDFSILGGAVGLSSLESHRVSSLPLSSCSGPHAYEDPSTTICMTQHDGGVIDGLPDTYQMISIMLPLSEFEPFRDAFPISTTWSTPADDSILGHDVMVFVRGGFAHADGTSPSSPATTYVLDWTPIIIRPSLITIKCSAGAGVSGPSFPKVTNLAIDVAKNVTFHGIQGTIELPWFFHVLDINAGGGDNSPSWFHDTTTHLVHFNHTGNVTGGSTRQDLSLIIDYYDLETAWTQNPLPVVYGSRITHAVACDASATRWVPVPEQEVYQSYNTTNQTIILEQSHMDHFWQVLRTEQSFPLLDEPDAVAQSILSYTSTSIVENHGSNKLGAKDAMRVTHRFNVGDYFAFDDLVSEITLTDGQTLDVTSVTYSIGSYSTHLNVTDASSIPINDTNAYELIHRYDGATGNEVLSFLMALTMSDRGESNIILGPRTDVRLAYETRILEDFRVLNPSDPSVDHYDTISNGVSTNAPMVNRSTLDELFITQQSSSGHTDAVGAGQVSLELYAINGELCDHNDLLLCDDPDPRFPVGYNVTYRLRHLLPSTDFEQLQLRVWHQSPMLVVDHLSIGGLTPQGTSGAIPPQPNAFSYGPEHTFVNVTPSYHTVGNEFYLDFGTFDDPNSLPTMIDLVYTLQVSDVPWEDDLPFASIAYSVERGRISLDSALIRIIQPALVSIELGMLGSSRSPDPNNSRFPVIPTYHDESSDAYIIDAPGRMCPSLSINGGVSAPLSGEEAMVRHASTLSNVDSGDYVMFALALRNVGVASAFDVSWSVTASMIDTDVTTGDLHELLWWWGIDSSSLVDNSTVFTSMWSTTVCSTRLDGMALMLDASPFAISQPTALARTLRDDDGMCSTQFPNGCVPVGSLLGGDDVSNDATILGDRMAVMGFVGKLQDNIEAGQLLSVTASLDGYASMEGGVNHIGVETSAASTASISQTVQLRVATPTMELYVVNTSLPGSAHVTSPPHPVAIGEVVHYIATITFPEGQCTDSHAVMGSTELIPRDLQFALDEAVMHVQDGPSVVNVHNGSVWLGRVVQDATADSSGGSVTIGGTFQIPDTPRMNQGALAIDSTFTHLIQPAGPLSSTAGLTLVEPKLSISMSTSESSVDELDRVNVTCTLRHHSSSALDAYNVTLHVDVELDELELFRDTIAYDEAWTFSHHTNGAAGGDDSFTLMMDQLPMGAEVSVSFLVRMRGNTTDGALSSATVGSIVHWVSHELPAPHDIYRSYSSEESKAIGGTLPRVQSFLITDTSVDQTNATSQDRIAVGEAALYRCIIDFYEHANTEYTIYITIPNGGRFQYATMDLATASPSLPISNVSLGTDVSVSSNLSSGYTISGTNLMWSLGTLVPAQGGPQDDSAFNEDANGLQPRDYRITVDVSARLANVNAVVHGGRLSTRCRVKATAGGSSKWSNAKREHIWPVEPLNMQSSMAASYPPSITDTTATSASTMTTIDGDNVVRIDVEYEKPVDASYITPAFDVVATLSISRISGTGELLLIPSTCTSNHSTISMDSVVSPPTTYQWTTSTNGTMEEYSPIVMLSLLNEYEDEGGAFFSGTLRMTCFARITNDTIAGSVFASESQLVWKSVPAAHLAMLGAPEDAALEAFQRTYSASASESFPTGYLTHPTSDLPKPSLRMVDSSLSDTSLSPLQGDAFPMETIGAEITVEMGYAGLTRSLGLIGYVYSTSSLSSTATLMSVQLNGLVIDGGLVLERDEISAIDASVSACNVYAPGDSEYAGLLDVITSLNGDRPAALVPPGGAYQWGIIVSCAFGDALSNATSDAVTLEFQVQPTNSSTLEESFAMWAFATRDQQAAMGHSPHTDVATITVVEPELQVEKFALLLSEDGGGFYQNCPSVCPVGDTATCVTVQSHTPIQEEYCSCYSGSVGALCEIEAVNCAPWIGTTETLATEYPPYLAYEFEYNVYFTAKLSHTDASGLSAHNVTFTDELPHTCREIRNLSFGVTGLDETQYTLVVEPNNDANPANASNVTDGFYLPPLSYTLVFSQPYDVNHDPVYISYVCRVNAVVNPEPTTVSTTWEYDWKDYYRHITFQEDSGEWELPMPTGLYGDGFYFAVKHPIADQRLQTEVAIAQNRVDRPCHYPSDDWTKRISDCEDTFTVGPITWPELFQCGWWEDEQGSEEGEICYVTVIEVWYLEYLTEFRGSPIYREVTSMFPLTICMPTRVTVATDIRVYAPINILAAIVVQEYDQSVEPYIALVDVVTEVQWPFHAENLALVSTPDPALQVQFNFSHCSAPQVEPNLCEQSLSLVINETTSPLANPAYPVPRISGQYTFSFDLACAASHQADCPIQAPGGVIPSTFVLTITANEVAIELDAPLVGTLTSYEDAQYSIERNNFFFDTEPLVYFEALVRSDYQPQPLRLQTCDMHRIGLRVYMAAQTIANGDPPDWEYVFYENNMHTSMGNTTNLVVESEGVGAPVTQDGEGYGRFYLNLGPWLMNFTVLPPNWEGNVVFMFTSALDVTYDFGGGGGSSSRNARGKRSVVVQEEYTQNYIMTADQVREWVKQDVEGDATNQKRWKSSMEERQQQSENIPNAAAFNSATELIIQVRPREDADVLEGNQSGEIVGGAEKDGASSLMANSAMWMLGCLNNFW